MVVTGIKLSILGNHQSTN